MSDYHRILTIWAASSPSARVTKLGPRWYVYDLERAGELLHGPSFVTKCKAVQYAEDNARAVLERLKEESLCR